MKNTLLKHAVLPSRRVGRPSKHDAEGRGHKPAGEAENKMLMMELSELNTFARHHFQLYLNWYTFFLTVNFVAIGWCTNSLLTETFKTTLPVVALAIFFLVQVILSYVGSLVVRNYFKGTCDRYNEILEAVAPPAPLPPLAPIPFKVYDKVISLMLQTLISFGAFWIGLAVLAVYLGSTISAMLKK